MLNKDLVLEKLVEAKGKLQKKWPILSDQEIEKAKGNLVVLAGILEKKLGISQKEAKKKIEGVLGNALMKGLELKGTIENRAEKTKKTADKVIKEVKSKLKK